MLSLVFVRRDYRRFYLAISFAIMFRNTLPISNYLLSAAMLSCSFLNKNNDDCLFHFLLENVLRRPVSSCLTFFNLQKLLDFCLF